MNYKLIAEKQKTFIDMLMPYLPSRFKNAPAILDRINSFESELSQLESEPDIDDAEISFNEHFEKEYKEALDEKEATLNAFVQIRDLFKARHWLMEGRGAYTYDDEGYKMEVRYLMDEFKEIEDSLWKQIKSKTFEYREKVKAQVLKDIEKQSEPDIDLAVKTAKEYLFSKYPLVSAEWFDNNEMTKEMLRMMNGYADYVLKCKDIPKQSELTERKTAEEILMKHWTNAIGQLTVNPHPCVIEAMEEYASQFASQSLPEITEYHSCPHPEKDLFIDKDGRVRCSDCHKVIE